MQAVKKLRIGYFADGPWGQRTFGRLLADASLEVVFLTVRYASQDEELKRMAEEAGIPVVLESRINAPEAMARYAAFQADLLVSMSFDQIFRLPLIEMPRLGTINCHAGKLPFYRGRNILNWALINDEKEFGITVHYVDEGIDTGDIILQRTFPITDEDNYATLLERAYDGCAAILYDAIKEIQAGTAHRVPQSMIDPVGMYCGQRREGDEVLDWDQPSRDIFNFVRAICQPGPMARSYIGGQEIAINRVRMIAGAPRYKNIPGQVLGKTGAGFLVKTRDTVLEVTEYSYDGKVRIGDRLRATQALG